jgi:hypothetical protein
VNDMDRHVSDDEFGTPSATPTRTSGGLGRHELFGPLVDALLHDFNNEISVITTIADILLRETPEGTANHEDYQDIKQASLEAAGLLKVLRRVIRSVATEPIDFDPEYFLADLVELVSRVLPTSVTITAVCEDSVETVHADPTQLQEIVFRMALAACSQLPSRRGRLVLRITASSADEGGSDRIQVAVEAHPPAPTPREGHAGAKVEGGPTGFAASVELVELARRMSGDLAASRDDGGFVVGVRLPGTIRAVDDEESTVPPDEDPSTEGAIPQRPIRDGENLDP